MKTYSSRIIDLRNALIGSIKTILRNNSLDEISISDSFDKTYVVWWSDKSNIYDGEVLLVRLREGRLSFVVDSENFTDEVELFEDSDFALESPIWLDCIRENILEALSELHERVCHECGKPMDEGFCIEAGREYYCCEECLYMHYTREEWARMHGDGTTDSYWTKWESPASPGN